MNGFLAKPVTLGELYDALAPYARARVESGVAVSG
jgi:hypothetical protein